MWLCLQTVSKEINKWRPLSCALIEYDSCPCKKRKLNIERNPRNGCTQGKGKWDPEKGVVCKWASPWVNQPQANYGLGCPASGAARKQMSALQASGDALFCHGSPSTLINEHCIESQRTQESLCGLYYNIAKHLHVKKETESYKLKTIIHFTKVWHYQHIAPRSV